MIAKDLISILQDFDPETYIILSKDPEGNGFLGLTDFSVEHVENTYEGGWLDSDDLYIVDPDDDEYDEIDTSAQFKKVVVLWP